MKEKTIRTHEKKLKKLNNGPLDQDYESLKTKLVHNISSYTLSPAVERILCRGWEFCVENKLTNFTEFKTDIELGLSPPPTLKCQFWSDFVFFLFLVHVIEHDVSYRMHYNLLIL